MAIWDKEGVYENQSQDTILKEIEDGVNKLKKFKKNPDRLLNEKVFLKFLDESKRITKAASLISAYSTLWISEDTNDQKALSFEAQISKKLTDQSNQLLFFDIWFKDLCDTDAKRLINAAGVDGYYFKRLRDLKDHMLDEPHERIISLKDLWGSTTVSKIYDMITNGYSFRFYGKTLNTSQINQYKISQSRKKRKLSYDMVLKRYSKDSAILSEIYRGIVGDWYSESVEIRGYKSPIDVRNKANDLDPKLVDTILDIGLRTSKIFQSYFKQKKELLSLDEFDRYDIYCSPEIVNEKISFQGSKQIVLGMFSDFNPQSGDLARKVFSENRVHSKIMKNKQLGAYCMSYAVGKTPYVMLNHIGQLGDVFTMAHEFGHAIHSMAASNLTELTFHSPLVLAETASTFSEMLLAERLLETEDKNLKKEVLLRQLDGLYAAICRQTYFTKFEIESHNLIMEGGSSDDLDRIYLDDLRLQFGKDIGVNEIFSKEWMYIGHMFQSPFYCYSYVFGNLLVLSLYAEYKKRGESFVDDYMRLLSLGGSLSPKDALEAIGIKISSKNFWENGLQLLSNQVKTLKKVKR